MRRERLLLLAAFSLTTGCYSYVPTTLDAVSPGDQVRLRISAVAADRLEPIRFTTSRDLDARLVWRDTADVQLDAFIRTVDATGITAIFTQRLNLPPADVQNVERRRLDMLKTGVAVGTVGAALGGAAYAVSAGLLRGRTREYEPIEMRSPFILQLSVPW